MSVEVRWRGGSTVEHSTFTGAPREVTVDTTKHTLVVHDGITVGGFPLLRGSGTLGTLTIAEGGTGANTVDMARANLKAVGYTSTDGSAILPVGTTATRDITPEAGYMRLNTDVNQVEVYNGTSWTAVGAGATGGGTDQVFYLNDQEVNNSYTLPADKNSVTAGPITIEGDVVIEGNWVIV